MVVALRSTACCFLMILAACRAQLNDERPDSAFDEQCVQDGNDAQLQKKAEVLLQHGKNSMAAKQLSSSWNREKHGTFALSVVQQLLNQSRDLTIIMVGANDGKLNASNDLVLDALAKPNIKAFLFEPNPTVFSMLQKNLMDQFNAPDRLIPVNSAVCDNSSGNVSFYVVSPRFAEECPDAPHFAKYELSSMDKSVVLSHYLNVGCGFQYEGDFLPYIEELQIPCLNGHDLMEANNIDPKKLDLLAVDAEGLDAKIVNSFVAEDLTDPPMIIYEHAHVPQEENAEISSSLSQKGYEITIDGMNSIVWKKDQGFIAENN